MTQLTILKAELLKWEADLIGFKNTISSQAHIMDSEIRQIEVELGAVRTFIAKDRQSNKISEDYTGCLNSLCFLCNYLFNFK